MRRLRYGHAPILLGAIPPEANQWCATEVIVTDGAAATEIVRLSGEREAESRRYWSAAPLDVDDTRGYLSRSLCPVLVTHDARPLPWPAAIQRATTQPSRGGASTDV